MMWRPSRRFLPSSRRTGASLAWWWSRKKQTQPLSASAERSQHIPIIAFPKEKLVDTNGAGDAYMEGFLSGLVQQSVAYCCSAGAYAPGVIVQQSGCTFPTHVALHVCDGNA